MPSVASQAIHSSHHGHAAQGRPTTPAAKEPETPFAQLLDQLGPPTADNGQGLGSDPNSAPRSTAPDDGTQMPKTNGPTKSEDKRQDAQGDGGDAKSANGAAGQAAATATDTAAASDGKQAAEIAKTDADSDSESGSESGSDADASTASTTTGQSAPGADAAAITPLLTPAAPQIDSATNSTDASSDASTVAIAAAGGGKTEPKTSTGALQAAADALSTNDPAASDASAPTADAANKADATGPSAADVKTQTDRRTASATQTQAPDNDGDAPATDVAAGTAAPPTPVVSDRKSGEVRPSGEPSPGKAEHHVHLADAAPASDTTAAAADLPAAADPGQGANPSPADGIQSASARTGDQPVNTAQTAGPPDMATAVPIAGLAVEIAARAQAGSNHFEIRLDPPELGRVEVRLDVDKSGHVNSRLVVDRPDTLDLLRRDAGDLQRALQQAGLTTTDDGMQFSLRDQGFAGYGNGDPSNTARLIVPDLDLNPPETAAVGYSRILPASGGIDIRV